MLNDAFVQAIVSAGYNCHYQPSVGRYRALTGRTGRYVCCPKAAAAHGLVWPGGLALDVYVGEHITIIRTYGAVAYYLPCSESALPLVKDALSMSTVEPMSRIPEQIVARHKAQEVEVVWLTEANAAECQEDVSSDTSFPYKLDEFVRLLQAAGVEVRAVTESFVSIGRGSADGFFPCLRGDTVAFLPLVFIGDVRDTEDQAALLRCVLSDSRLVAFDDPVGGRIDLSDKFYDLPSLGPRPNAPAAYE